MHIPYCRTPRRRRLTKNVWWCDAGIPQKTWQRNPEHSRDGSPARFPTTVLKYVSMRDCCTPDAFATHADIRTAVKVAYRGRSFYCTIQSANNRHCMCCVCVGFAKDKSGVLSGDMVKTAGRWTGTARGKGVLVFWVSRESTAAAVYSRSSGVDACLTALQTHCCVFSSM